MVLLRTLCALWVLALAPSASVADAAKVPRRLLERTRQEGAVRVVVELAESVAPEGTLNGRAAIGQRARIAGTARRLARTLSGTGSRVLRSFETVPYVALSVDGDGLEALERSALVASVEEDALAFPTLANSVPVIGADLAHDSGWNGAGQTIVVLDTGIAAEHPFLGGRVVAEACFSSGGSCPGGGFTEIGPGAGAPCDYAPQACAHGTHVAGIAAGAGDAFSGVAPEADLVSIQIFSRFDDATCTGGSLPCAASYTSDQVAALEHVLTLAETFPIAAVNMSLGGTTIFTSQENCDARNRSRKAIMEHLASVGVVIVAAAGNEGSIDGLTSPGCISSTLSVGATTGTDTVAAFSNTAPYLQLLAPGVAIESAAARGGFVAKSGTSMSAPLVSGAIALLRQKAPEMSAASLVERLVSTGIPVTDVRTGRTTPRISVNAALGGGMAGSPGLLEVPLDGRFASGIGAFSGWVCDATEVAIRVDGGTPMKAAYGTARNDTERVCGDRNNGFSLLHNFSRDGAGMHTAELLADGVVIGRSTYLVSTFGVPFLRDAPESTYILRDFLGRDVAVRWLQEKQGFEIIGVE